MYDLAAETSRFIAVVDGGDTRKASMLECLTRAAELKLDFSRAAESVATVRTLCALIQDAFRPTRADAAALALEGFDERTLSSYLAAQPLRLFSGRPFWQVKGLTPRAAWTQLDLARNSNSTRVVDDHTLTHDPSLISYGDAVTKLMTFQTFTCNGGRGHAAAPLSNRFVCCAVGKTLAATLCANLPFDDGIPIWRANLHTQKRVAAQRNGSHLSLYTPLTRAVQLHKEQEGVRFVGYSKGLDMTARLLDPMVIYKRGGRELRSSNVSGFDRIADLIYGVNATPPAILETATRVGALTGGDPELIVVAAESSFANPLRLRTPSFPLAPEPRRLSHLREAATTARAELTLHLRSRLDKRELKARKRVFDEQVASISEAFLYGRQPREVFDSALQQAVSSLTPRPARARNSAYRPRSPTKHEVHFVAYLGTFDRETLMSLTKPPGHPLFPTAVLAPLTTVNISERDAFCFDLLAHLYALNSVKVGEARTLAAACAAMPEARSPFILALNAPDIADLAQTLPSAVRMVAGTPLKWPTLLRDLRLWGDPRVRRRWKEQFNTYEGENREAT